jgi:hypothetical protein
MNLYNLIGKIIALRVLLLKKPSYYTLISMEYEHLIFGESTEGMD